jgi:hypothetical protein
MIAPVAAQASPNVNMHSINSRLHNQQRRIDNGIRHGGLTPRESARLEARETSIRDREAIDRRHDHGRLTAGEHRRLERSENRTSNAIYRDRHNAHRAF